MSPRIHGTNNLFAASHLRGSSRINVGIPFSNNGPPPPFNLDSVFFNGVDQYVNLGLNYAFERTDTFSLVYWAKTQITPGLGGALISNITNTAIHRGWNAVAYDAGAGQVMAIGLNNNESGTLTVVQTSSAFTQNVWNHWIIAYPGVASGVGTKIYKNGISQPVDIPVATLSGTMVSTEPLNFGRHNYGGYYKGLLNQIGIFAGTFIDDATALAIYMSGGNVALFSPSSRWPMGTGDTYPTLLDTVAGKNGTMINMSAANIVLDVP